MSARLRAGAFSLSLTITFLWSLHPLQTESVSYIIQRAESLVGLFYVATLYFFLRAVEQPARACWAIASVAACFLGMGTKEVMVTAPVVVLLMDRTFVSGTFREAWNARIGLYLGLFATWILLVVCVISTGGRGSTAGFNTDVTVWRYALTQCYAIALYLKLVVWPWPLVVDYGGSLATDLAEVWPYVLFIVGLVSAVTVTFVRRPKLGFLGLLFFLLLAPSSSVVPVASQTIAEHRMYLPLVAIVAAAVLGLDAIIGKRSIYFFVVTAVALACVTYHRNGDYRSELFLWGKTAEDRPQNFRAFYSYGLALEKAKSYPQAKDAYERATELNPSNRDLKIRYAGVLQQIGETQHAIAVLEETLAIRNARPFAEAYFGYANLGVLLGIVGRREEGIPYLLTAVSMRPEAEEARLALGNAYLSLGRFPDAQVQYQAILTRNPRQIEARYQLSEALLKNGSVAEAIQTLEAALGMGLKSAELYAALGNAWLAEGRNPEARQQFEEALRIDPAYGPAHMKLGLLFSAEGDEQAASNHYEQAIAGGIADPALLAVSGGSLLTQGHIAEGVSRLEKAAAGAREDPDIKFALANGLLRAQRLVEAARIYEELLSLNPRSAELHNRLGLAYRMAGRVDDAQAQFQQARALDPSNKMANQQLLELTH